MRTKSYITIKRVMVIVLSIVLALAIAIYVFMQQAQFGKLPANERLEKIKRSPNYKNGAFQNLSHTPDLTEGATYFSVMKKFLFSEKIRNKPVDTIPAMKTDLLNLDPEEDVLVWFGHSSYFIQVDGMKILVDPVLSGSASPLSFTTTAFPGTDVYSTDDIPMIDYLFITHDHWDHLDYKTILELKSRVNQVICGLGTGEHLEYWGYDKGKLIEKDWNEQVLLDGGFAVQVLPARHFSGRGFKRNQSLWVSFALKTPTKNIYIGGDGGYDTHFTDIGKAFGGFDLAILENGQYDQSWKYIHMMPEEVLQAAKDLLAKRVIPVHSSKFALGNHSWDEPLRKVTELNGDSSLKIITPMIGEKVNLRDINQTFTKWWEGVN